jgi:serine/threonine protein phosphatase PrpC
LKWSKLQLKEAKEKFRSKGPGRDYETPPYMTAEPVVTETDVNTGPRGDFLVMASDGVWDHLSSEDAVECVARWINWMKTGKRITSNPKEYLRIPHQCVAGLTLNGRRSLSISWLRIRMRLST